MFYVYGLINPLDNNTIFYIGKGTGDRVLLHEQFKSKCNNPIKDAMIALILENNKSVPYIILHDNLNEKDAYDLEEKEIKRLGLENLTNICDSARPPSQMGKKRNQQTIDKIKEHSKKQGLERTIEHCISIKDIVYGVLTDINSQTGKRLTLEKYAITSDLYHKIKRNRPLYTNILNEHTEYSIKVHQVTKIAGMQLKVFNDKKDILINMYNLIDQKIPRRQIAKDLGIDLAFYDRMKDKKDSFYQTIKA